MTEPTGGGFARIFPFAFVMARYRTFGILLRFQFQITAAAACAVRLLRIAQNHALSALLHDFFHHRTRFFNIFDRGLFDNDDVRRIFFQTAFQYGQPLIKISLCFRQVENVQLDAAPISVGRTCGGGNPLKLPARTVKLAIQRIGRKIAGKPRPNRRVRRPISRWPPSPARFGCYILPPTSAAVRPKQRRLWKKAHKK